MDATNHWGQSLQDAILDNSALRDGLTDDEAQPLIDWGLDLAATLTQGLDRLPDVEAEARYEQLYAHLPKLMTRFTWLALHRAAKGQDWATRTLEQMNDYSRELYGPAAPQLNALALGRYASGADALERGALILALMADFSPPPPPQA
jgi:hypothetical protein